MHNTKISFESDYPINAVCRMPEELKMQKQLQKINL
jgi:hypothetical protein